MYHMYDTILLPLSVTRELVEMRWCTGQCCLDCYLCAQGTRFFQTRNAVVAFPRICIVRNIIPDRYRMIPVLCHTCLIACKINTQQFRFLSFVRFSRIRRDPCYRLSIVWIVVIRGATLTTSFHWNDLRILTLPSLSSTKPMSSLTTTTTQSSSM